MLIQVPRLTQRTLILFLLPILTVPTVSVVGELMFSDIAVAILAPLMFFSRVTNFNQPYMKKIFWLIGIWLVGVVISDAVNGSSLGDFLRGMASVVFFGLHLFVFFVLVDGKRERCISAIFGSAVAVLMQWVTADEGLYSEALTDTPWKMGGGFAVSILFLLLMNYFYLGSRKSGLLLILLSPVHLFLNARSLFLTTVVAGFLSLFKFSLSSKKDKRIFFMALGFFVLILVPMSLSIYGHLTSSGFFGEEAKEKHLAQTANGEINILIAGRSEILISSQAISDSPILGHGSWAQSIPYYYAYLGLLDAMGRSINWDYIDSKDTFLIPAHSLLLQAWVFHGLFGAFFWFYVFFIALRALGLNLTGERMLSPIEVIIIVALIWDIFFSPFGQARRCIEAIYIVVACLIVSDTQKVAVIK